MSHKGMDCPLSYLYAHFNIGGFVLAEQPSLAELGREFSDMENKGYDSQ